jgi:protein gp37/ParB-like chromosome segregation protein Spo0J
MNPKEIKTKEPFNRLFPIDYNIEEAIFEHMKEHGYDQDQPVILWKEENVVVDGHTRLQVAKRLGLEDISVSMKSFPDELSALKHAIHNQRDRRNFTDVQILACIEIVDKVRERGGDRKSEEAKSKTSIGAIDSKRSSEQTAKVVGISPRKVERARKVLSDPEEKEAVLKGQKTIHKAAQDVKEKTQDKKFTFNKTTESIEWALWTWNPVTGCRTGCHYCVEENTPILMANGAVIKIKDIKIGDKIIGTHIKNGYHKLIESTVLNSFKTNKKSYEITLEDGRKLICSGDHRWLNKRGRWKYTNHINTRLDKAGKINHNTPNLTTNDKLMGFNQMETTPTETIDYMQGYLSGIIRGDGHLKRHKDKRREDSYVYQFRLALKDKEGVERCKNYLKSFGIDIFNFKFSMQEKKTDAIRINTKLSYSKIKQIINYKDNHEYYRGFLSGIFDSEGSADVSFIRIFNSDMGIIRETIKALKFFNFKFVYDKATKPKNKTVRTVRITGGFCEVLRFFQLCNPAIKRKLKIIGTTIKNNQKLSVVSIQPLNIILPMCDITTTSEDFIANGVVSHNCYARNLTKRFPDNFPYGFEPHFWEERLGAPKNSPLPKSEAIGDRNVFVCSMADLFGEWVPQEWIDKILDKVKENPQWNFLFLTKNPKRLINQNWPENCWVGTTADTQKRFENAIINLEELDKSENRPPVIFISFEPLLEEIFLDKYDLSCVEWIIIGGQSSAGDSPEFQPEWKWVEKILIKARENNCDVYFKPNLKSRPKEYPMKGKI